MGKFSDTTGLISDSECTECRANTFIADSGGLDGDAQKHDNGGEDCLPCEEGTYSEPGSQYKSKNFHCHHHIFPNRLDH